MTKTLPPPAFEEEPTEFITVDLEVYSRRRLSRLADALGRHLSLSYDGGEKGNYFCAFGAGGFFWTSKRRLVTADQQILALVRLVRTLPPEAAALWASARSRNFDVGIQTGLHPQSYPLSLSPKTLAEAASVNAKIVITVYAPVPISTPRK